MVGEGRVGGVEERGEEREAEQICRALLFAYDKK